MGIGDFFRRRRQRESALPPGELEALSRGAEQGGAQGEPGQPGESGAGTELPGADPAGFGAMIRRAVESGLPQISTESHRIDLRGSGLREEILGILGTHGIEPGQGRQIDASQVPGLQERLREALREQGIEIPAPDSDQPGGETSGPEAR